jgi:hypothetical protein
VRDVNANFLLDGNQVRLEKAEGHHTEGDFNLTGRLDLAKPRSPQLDITLKGTNQSQPFSVTVKGPAAKPVIAATVVPPPPALPQPAPPVGAEK